MSIRKLTKMPSINNVNAGATCTCELPVGLTYDKLQILLTNITLAQLSNIEIRANGKTIQEFKTGTEIDALNKFHGRRAFANGVLDIWFIRPELNLPVEQRMTALGTADLSTLAFHADINAACSSPAMEMLAQQSEREPMGVVTKIRRFPRSSAAAGLFEISNLPKLGNIACVHFFKSDVSHVLAKVDGRETVDASKVQLEEFLSSMGKNSSNGDLYAH